MTLTAKGTEPGATESKPLFAKTAKASLFKKRSDEKISSASSSCRTWKVAIVDDDEQVHQVTKLALSGFSFRGDRLELVHAYSGKEARELFQEHPDIAVLLLDVVMEDDHSGLEFAKHVREELKNAHVRIVLRTGQPGHAPESRIISDYDINDYKEKTELTAQKLYTLMFSCLRSYRDIMALERNRRGLEHVISASQDIFTHDSISTFAEGVMEQISSLLYADQGALMCELNGLVTHENRAGITFLAGTGKFENKEGKVLNDFLPGEVLSRLSLVEDDSGSIEVGDHFLSYLSTKDGHRNILLISGVRFAHPSERRIMNLFCQNALIAFDNLNLRVEIEETQRELVYRLGEAVETRSRETGNHVQRVAEFSKILALKSGMSARDAEILKHASPMHDLGKIGIPDSILNKPAKLTEEEWEIMQNHASLGAQMLGNSDREILNVGAIVALEHHEKWDGTGYPNGKSGEEISLVGRITAITDVFDALSSDRCYKNAWPHDEVVQYLISEKGKHFDPDLVDLFIENMDEMRSVQSRYP
ncbi:DUF3369 domain-containing protein [Labrenzia sp. VG12]|uniref:DUF3369 domain-containing protein n=1 Tax=Labrenzia sp. VG12 TaxID=2021862 RepID=UPI000B8C5FBC|nr:DUF3369 domain-containing protein [Labrenzia sp. VG12]ASP33458.1 metal-dependent phosphohydrolase [Labrenzia sp. VG12]